MLSIVIADDEAGIIELCKMLIEYPHAAVIGEAHNGLELYDKIAELHPNTVITDLSMPGMTGLEVIEEAQTAFPDVNFIVMSGYTDFEYVQKALRFGVWDYLLKPLQKVELNRILQKLDEQLESRQMEGTHQESVQEDLDKSMHALKERYLLDVWQTGSALPVPMIGEKKVLDFGQSIIQCLLFCTEQQIPSQTSNEAPLRQQSIAVIDEFADLARQICPDVQVFSDASCYSIFVLFFPNDGSAEETSQNLQKQISSHIRNYNNYSRFVRIACAASELLTGQESSLPRIYDQVKAAIKWRLEKRDGNVIRYRSETVLALQNAHPFTKDDALHDAILSQDAEQACKLIRSDWEPRDAQPIGSAWLLLEEQLRCLNDAMRQLPGAEQLPGLLHITLQDALSGGPSSETLPLHICELIRNILHEYEEFFLTRENSIVVQAKQYVAQHFAEDITLNDIAKHVCLSPAYFSTVFKNETGTGFVKYLQHVRIEHAKKLLKNSKMRISDIAQAVGYHDLKFFNKIFYNETTVTPSEYRKFYT